MKIPCCVLVLFFSCTVLSAQDNAIRLLIRADDIGSAHASNLGCIKAYREGIVQSVEFMSPCSWTPEAIRMLNENPGLDVGVHLTLTSEWENYRWRPMSHAPSLTDKNGFFFPFIYPNKETAGISIQEAPWKIEEIEREFRAQIEYAKNNISHLTHLSYHMGSSSWDPKVAALTDKLAKEYGLYMDMASYNLKSFPKIAGRDQPVQARIQSFIQAIQSLTPGTYLFVEHPAVRQPEMEPVGHKGYMDVAQDRDGIVAIFTSPEVKKAIEVKGVKLVSYGDLKKEKR